MRKLTIIWIEMGYGKSEDKTPPYLTETRILYKNAVIRIKYMNEQMSEPITAKQGVRQGHGFSPSLFNIYHSTKINGINMLRLKEKKYRKRVPNEINYEERKKLENVKKDGAHAITLDKTAISCYCLHKGKHK
jgi:hypothetical protein